MSEDTQPLTSGMMLFNEQELADMIAKEKKNIADIEQLYWASVNTSTAIAHGYAKMLNESNKLLDTLEDAYEKAKKNT